MKTFLQPSSLAIFLLQITIRRHFDSYLYHLDTSPKEDSTRSDLRNAVLKHPQRSSRFFHGWYSSCAEFSSSQLVRSHSTLALWTPSITATQLTSSALATTYDKECQDYAGHEYPASGQVTGGPYGSQAIIWVDAGDPYCCDGKLFSFCPSVYVRLENLID